MSPTATLRHLLASKPSSAPTAICLLISQRSFFDNASKSSLPKRKAAANSSPKYRTQSKSTLTFESSSISIPHAGEIYKAPAKPDPTITENDTAPDATSVPTALSIPKAAKKTISSDPFCNRHLPQLNYARFMNNADNPLQQHSFQRKVKRQTLTKHMQLITVQNEGEEKSEKPLVLLYPWLMCKPKHVEKYSRLYTDLGIDVLQINISPHDLLRPVPRSHVAAIQLLDYLLENPKWNKLLQHGLSVGAYGFMEVMTKIEENEDRYLGVRSKFVGQIWDSPCDLPGLKEGVSRSITKNRAMQLKIMQFLEWFLHVRYEAATKHYVKTQDMYYKNYLNTGGLWLYSRADKIASPKIVTDLVNHYDNSGFEAFSHVFDQSPHVGHYPKYSEVYKANVMAYLEHIGMLKEAGINLE